MIIFISGSVNSGKSTTSELIAQKLGAEWLDIDELADSIPNFSLDKDLPRVINLAVETINKLTEKGKDVVANYVLREEDYKQLKANFIDPNQYYFTLAPRFEVARSDRGRGMNDWEYQRIKYHYDTGIANPTFGKIIDNSDLTLEETADKIIGSITYNK